MELYKTTYQRNLTHYARGFSFGLNPKRGEVGMNFIKFHADHADILGNIKYELYFEYLRSCQAVCKKDADGYFRRSTTQINRALSVAKIGRKGHITARQRLKKLGWIDYKNDTGNSPYTCFKVLKSD